MLARYADQKPNKLKKHKSRFSADPENQSAAAAAAAAAAQPTGQVDSVAASQSLLQQIETKVTTAAEISFFIMGILSNWMPLMEKIYMKIRNVTYFFKPCFKAISTIWNLIKGKSTETDPQKIKENEKELKKINNDESEIAKQALKDENESAEKKKKLCTKTEEIIWKAYDKYAKVYIEYKAGRENHKRNCQNKNYQYCDPETFCNYMLLPAATKAHKIIDENFDSREDYLETCIMLRKSDCSQFQPDNRGAWNYIKSSMKYLLLVKNGAVCVMHALKVGGADESTGQAGDQEVVSMYQSMTSGWEITKGIFTQLGSFLLHLVSFGIWGALKAAWLVIKLALKLLILYNNFMFDLPFNLGKLTGMAINVVKSLFVGRRFKKYRK